MRPLLRLGACTLLCVAALAAGACGSDAGIESASRMYHVTAERNGDVITLHPGDVLSVVLPTVAGSPAHWEAVISDTAVVEPIGNRGVLAPRRNGTLIGGTQGYERQEFLVRRTGIAVVHLERSLAGAGGPRSGTFEVTVRSELPVDTIQAR